MTFGGLRVRRALLPADYAAIDLVDPRTHAELDLTEFWRHLRAESPVHWYPPDRQNPGFWVLSRHADILSVYRDSATFTSEYGNVLVTLLAGGDTAAGRMLPVTDGQRHKDIRTVVLKAVTARTLGGLEAKVREHTRRILAAAIEQGECELAADVAEPASCATICELLGVPESDRADILSWSRCAVSADEPDQSAEAVWAARNEMLRYFRSLLAYKRRRPDEGVISSMAQALVNGDRLADEDIVFNCYSLILGGDETARLTVVDAAYTFDQQPAKWEEFRFGDVALDTAVEEVLRWATPAMTTGRSATADATVGGQRIRAGEIVTLWNFSANRDERVFTDPDTFLLTRQPNRHVSFGYGPHFCLGAALGRIELREMLDALRTLCASIQVIGPPRIIHSTFMRGMSRLPVRLVPDQAALAREACLAS